MSTMRFQTTVAKSGTRTYVAIPFDPNEAWGSKARHHVAGTVNGCRIRGTLGSDGAQFFLLLGAAWRRDNGMAAGDVVDVGLDAEGPQIDSVSPDVAAALEAEPRAKAFFDALASFYRNNYVRWVESAKRPETRTKRIGEMIDLLKNGTKQR